MKEKEAVKEEGIRFEDGVYYMPNGEAVAFDEMVAGAVASLVLVKRTLDQIVKDGGEDVAIVLAIRTANAIADNTPSRKAFDDLLDYLQLSVMLAEKHEECGCEACSKMLALAENTARENYIKAQSVAVEAQ